MKHSVPTVSDYRQAQLPSRWLIGAIILGFWTVFSLVLATQFYFGLNEQGIPASWLRTFLWQILGWYAWAGLTPLVVWLGRRFPIERSKWKYNLPIHIVASLVLVFIHIVYYSYATHLLDPLGRGASGDNSFDQIFAGFVRLWAPQEFFIYCTMLGVGSAFNYYYKYLEREVQTSELRGQLATAQLQALRMQLHPHFLFNTLHSLAGLVRNNQSDAAVDMIAELSDLMRIALENSGKQEIPLREEFQFLKSFLEIQQIRFSNRLQVETNIKDNVLGAYVPNLIMQPLVENAIKHGIAMDESARVIAITAEQTNGQLSMTVYNNGPSLPKDWTLGNSEGIGLANTSARLKQIYGANHRFDLQNKSGGGVEARIVIPLSMAPVLSEG